MGKWINTKGWLRGYVNKKTTVISANKTPAVYGVIFYPIKCPRCGSKDTKCYSSTPPVRYHKCKSCGYRFKSQEAEENE